MQGRNDGVLIELLKAVRVYLSSEIKEPYALGLSYKLYAWKNKCKELGKYHNINLNKRCFIIGTGPSLTLEDVNSLSGEVCIGVNTLYKIYDKTKWRADYYCIIDPKTYENVKEHIVDYGVKNVFIAQNRIKDFAIKNDNRFIPFNLNCSSFYRIFMRNRLEKMRFSGDITKEVYDGASVIFAALQIACYMGFKEIYLLGSDCNYDTELLHAGTVGYSEGYNYNWTSQTGLTMIEGFKVAKKYADAHEINIYNATRGGMLEVFPRVNLEDVLGG